MSKFNRRRFIKTGGSMMVLGAASGASLLPSLASAQETVKLGLLHSLSGTIAIAEAALVEAEKMAIEEINASGGVTRLRPSLAATPQRRAKQCCRYLTK